LLLLSADRWEHYLAVECLGLKVDYDAFQRRMGGQGGRGKREKGVVNARGDNTLVVTPKLSLSQTTEEHTHAVLTRGFSAVAFGDALIPAYVPVMHNLQGMADEDVPFGAVLAGIDTQPQRPAYIPAGETTVDMSYLYTGAGGGDLPEGVEDAFETLEMTEPFPGEDTLGAPDLPAGVMCRADPTQLKAIRHTLNNQVSVIRGGPGTGKSYTAMRLLEKLYHEHGCGRLGGVVLLLTKTNQALDTLLEGILDFASSENLLRIGGRPRTKDDRILDRMLSKCRREVSHTLGMGLASLYEDREEAYFDGVSAIGRAMHMAGPLRDTLVAMQAGEVD
ncbi:hypothetical protein KIPB_013323, partial [Kipferlia bialata]